MIINTSKIRPLQIKWWQYGETKIFRADPQCPFKKGGGQ